MRKEKKMLEEVREKSIISGKSLFVLHIFCNPTDNFDVGLDGEVVGRFC
jgi:hypothetical protein